jgi:hypothetical protein
MQLVQQRRIGIFHGVWAPGHNSTDYDKFYSAEPEEIYKVTSFHSAYEPYTIFRKDGPPWYVYRFSFCSQGLVRYKLTWSRSIGATRGSLVTVETKLRAFMRCISLGSRSMSFRTILSFIKIICMRRKQGRMRYVL